MLTEKELIKTLSSKPIEPCNLKVGDIVTFTNEFGVKFEDMTVIGFCEPWNGRSVHLSKDAYWFPVPVSSLKIQDNDSQKSIVIEWAGKKERVIGRRGDYPYDCISKDQRPYDFIYYFNDGSWVPEHNLTLLNNGNYTINMI